MLTRIALAALIALGTAGLTAATSTDASAKPVIIKPIKIKGPIFKPIKVVKIHHWHRSHIVRPLVVATTAYPVVRRATRACLTKEYLPTGQVMFRDVCTNEWAMNPPPVEQVQVVAPQAQVVTPQTQAAPQAQ
jgi:hypothetical protein